MDDGCRPRFEKLKLSAARCGRSPAADVGDDAVEDDVGVLLHRPHVVGETHEERHLLHDGRVQTCRANTEAPGSAE